MSKPNNFIFEESETESDIMKLNEMFYNCTECSSPIEILYINEKTNIIEFKCTINKHLKKLSIKEYINEMKKFNDKNIHNDICLEDNHNKEYEFYCLNCKKHLCKECIKTRDHINHNKKIILEIQPSKKELNIIDNIIKFYEDKINNLEKDKFNKIKEMKNKLKESENKLKEKIETKNEEKILNKQNIKDNYGNKNEITNEYKSIDDNLKNAYEKELLNLKGKYERKIKRYNFDEYIENMHYIKRLIEIIYNAYNTFNHNYYNSININNILISIFNNKTYTNDDISNEYENIIKIKNETINIKNKIKYNNNLNNILSIHVFKTIFSCIREKKKLEIIHYNKRIQNNLDINLNNYRNFTGKYLIYESIVKEFSQYDNELIYEGEYLNGKRNGKGKEYDYDGNLIYEGE